MTCRGRASFFFVSQKWLTSADRGPPSFIRRCVGIHPSVRFSRRRHFELWVTHLPAATANFSSRLTLEPSFTVLRWDSVASHVSQKWRRLLDEMRNIFKELLLQGPLISTECSLDYMCLTLSQKALCQLIHIDTFDPLGSYECLYRFDKLKLHFRFVKHWCIGLVAGSTSPTKGSASDSLEILIDAPRCCGFLDK